MPWNPGSCVRRRCRFSIHLDEGTGKTDTCIWQQCLPLWNRLGASHIVLCLDFDLMFCVCFEISDELIIARAQNLKRLHTVQIPIISITRYIRLDLTRTSLVGRRRPGSVQSVCPSTSVYTTWHLDTCRHSASLCPFVLGRLTYAQLIVVNWTSPVSICPRTGDGRLPTPVPHPGTRCLTISRTLIFPFKLSNVILRHSSFPHTSTFSAFDVSY